MSRELMLQKNQERLSELNRARNEQMRERIVTRLETALGVLREFAVAQEIPEKVPMPSSLPMVMNEHSIQNIAYRNYMIRKHMEQASRTLQEVMDLPSKAFPGFLCDKVIQQEQAVIRLLTVLQVPMA